MSANGGNRVVVRRRRRQRQEPHSGSWKIAYADFMTAMMAFFLVMWLIGITSQGDREGIAEFFRMPLRVALTGGDRTSDSSSLIPGGGADFTHTEGEVRRSDPSTQSIAQGELERRDAVRLENLRSRLESLIERNPVLHQYHPQLLVDITSEGLRIQIVDDQSRPMFPTGSARVEPHMRAILREIGPTLNDLPNKISLAGHTDATLYSSGERAYSNWELSADRANASRRELIAGGMDGSKVLRIMGLGSTMPLVRDDPHAAINRRISLVVLNVATQRRIERENMSAADSRSVQAELDALRNMGTAAPSGLAGDAPAGSAEPGEAVFTP